MKEFKLFDTSQGKMDLEANVNAWLAANAHIEIISTNLVWDENDLVFTILYKK